MPPTTISGPAALAAFREQHLTGPALLDYVRGAGQVLIPVPVGVGKSYALDELTVAAITSGAYDLVLVLVPTRQLINERAPLRNPPAGVPVVNLRPRPSRRCGPVRDAQWAKLEATGLGAYGRKQVCGACPHKATCFWPGQYGRGLAGAGIVYATQAHLERDPAFPRRVATWSGGRKPLTLVDENNFLGAPRDRTLTYTDLARYADAVEEVVAAGRGGDRLVRYLDDVRLLPRASTVDVQHRWRFPVPPTRMAAAVQEAGVRRHPDGFRYLGYDLAQFAKSPVEARRAGDGRVEFTVRPFTGDTVIFSGTADPVFTGHRLGGPLISPFAGYRFEHPDTRWFNLSSPIGSRKFFRTHAPQVLDFFAGLVALRVKAGKRVLLVSRKCFRELCAEGMRERFAAAGLDLTVLTDGWTASRLSDPSTVPLITYGMIGTNAFQAFDAAYCLNSYYVPAEVVNRCLQDVTRADLRLPIEIRTTGRPRRRTAGVVHPDHRYYDTAALAQPALEFVEHSTVVQAVGRVRPFTLPREVITFQAAALPGVAYAAEFDTLAQARAHFGIPTLRAAKTATLANRVVDLRRSGLTQAAIARKLGVSEKTVRNHLKRTSGNQTF